MFKKFNGILNNNIKTYFIKTNFHMYKINYFGRKSGKTVQLDDLDPDIQTEDYIDSTGNKLDYVKVYKGEFPYMPLDDHPLIPGYARMIAVSREITDKLKEINAEKTKLIISVLKNPEKVEALQASM